MSRIVITKIHPSDSHYDIKHLMLGAIIITDNITKSPLAEGYYRVDGVLESKKLLNKMCEIDKVPKGSYHSIICLLSCQYGEEYNPDDDPLDHTYTE